MHNRPAYTAMELLMTIALIGLIAAIGVPAFGAMQRQALLHSVTQEVADAVRTSQNRALTARDGSHHQIQTAGSNYSLITVSGGATETRSVPANISLSGATATFERLTGICTDCPAGDTVINVALGGKSQTIRVAPSGHVRVE